MDDQLPTASPTIGALIRKRFSRRETLVQMLGAAVAGTALSACATAPEPAPAKAPAAKAPPTVAPSDDLAFAELPHGYDETFHVADGYDAQVLIRWGDPVLPSAPRFTPASLKAADQQKQFGYNCDFIGYMPLPRGSDSSDHGLLCVNNEYTNAEMMWPGVDKRDKSGLTREQTEYEMAAHGHSVVEIRKRGGRWDVVSDSRYNRRIDALDTVMMVAGPAAGHARLKTAADASGSRVIGTLNNCAGGVTPWGTVLFAEENIQNYFGGTYLESYTIKPGDTLSALAVAVNRKTGGQFTVEQIARMNKIADPNRIVAGQTLKLPAHKEAYNHFRMGLKEVNKRHAWWKHVERFDMSKAPNEPNRFGWMIEYDPYDPASVPVKRTAMGRFKHEGANVAISRTGHAVAYMGDDERFDYLYRFVSNGKYNPDDRAANMRLLDDGILSVAKFSADGTLEWLPLVHGEGPLTPRNGFASQADVVIDCRRAADLLGATPMDRPEDVEPNPVTGVVYVMLTNNTHRKAGDENPPNPRAANTHGHIIEVIPPGLPGEPADHTKPINRWDIFLLAGDPAREADKARYGAGVTANGWLSCPDNCAFDNRGRLWIATDGAPGTAGFADGLWAAETQGPKRASTRHFLRTPRGAELCGPYFTPDNQTLFVAVQHPADEDEKKDKDGNVTQPASTYDNPSTRWPDFDPKIPPRPSVVAITRKGGGPVGA